jgi:hypothetical protein
LTTPDTAQRERDDFGLDLTEVRHEPVASSTRLRLYVAVLCVFPFALIAFTLWWVTTDTYLRHIPFPYLSNTGYGSKLHNANCDVVIDGDSTALVGILPRIIHERTGLKTCNIAEVAGIKLVSGNIVLDDYLAHNRPPRVLVFLFAPENLTPPQQWISVGEFEGWFYRVRFHRDRVFWHNMLHNPDDAFANVELAFRNGLQWLPKHPRASELTTREQNDGFVTEPGPPLTRCAGDTIIRPPDPTWLNFLRSHYGVNGTRVLIDVTPMPACDEGLAFYRAHLHGLTDNSVDTLPLNNYNASGRLHTTEAGTAALSNRIADQIAGLTQTLSSRPESPRSGDGAERPASLFTQALSSRPESPRSGGGVERPLYFRAHAAGTTNY